MLVKVFYNNKSHAILFDAGNSPNGVLKNTKIMEIDLSEIECIIISHGHYDHFGGLKTIVKAIGRNDLPVIIQEDMLEIRGMANSKGVIIKYPCFPKEEMLKLARYIKTKQTCLIANDLILMTGEIPRKPVLRKGYPQNRVFIDGKMATWSINFRRSCACNKFKK